MKISDKITTLVSDMDGTIYLSDTPIEGAVAAIKRLREKRRILFLTNNTSVDGNAYVKKLCGMGIEVQRKDIITAGDAAAAFIETSFPDKKIYVLGTEAFKAELDEKGIKTDENDPDVVLLSFDTELTYKKLEKACDLIRAGLPLISTHPDINCPKKEGFKPDVGSFIALIKASTGRNPDFICGKPDKIMTNYLLEYSKASAEQIMMIGDRLYTDIEFAVSSGFKSCLVLSGETHAEAVKAYRKHIDIVVGSIAELE